MVLDLRQLRQNDDIGGLLLLYFETNVPGGLTLLAELLSANVGGLLLGSGPFDIEELPLFEFRLKQRRRWRRRDKRKADGQNVGQMTRERGGFLGPQLACKQTTIRYVKG